MTDENLPAASAAAEFKTRDASSYDSVTDAFDRFTERCTQPIAGRMVHLAKLALQSQVLDVGTGTGVVAFEAVRRLGSGGQVVGVDLSEGMLDKATRKARELDIQGVRFQREDAEALSQATASFDVVLSLYALFHFPHPDRALAEMFRVLKPGGRLVLAVGSGPPMRSRHWPGYVLKRLPLLVQRRRDRWLVAPDLINELVDQLLPRASATEESEMAKGRGSHMSPTLLPSLIRGAGFVDLATSVEARLEQIEGIDAFWELQSTFSSIARKRLQAVSPEEGQRVRTAFDARCSKVQAAGGKLVYPYAAYIVSARRPK